MIYACACMGPMYGEPYCYCSMKSRGLEKEMEENPLRIAANQRLLESMKDLEKFFDMNRKKSEQ